MDYFLIATIVVALAAIFGYLNERFFKLPGTIGLMLMAVLFTLALFIWSQYNPDPLRFQQVLVSQVNFKDLLLNSMLSFLLFAGALNINFDELRPQLGPVLSFATIGVLISTFLIGMAMYYLLPLIGLEVQLIHCMLFGALISPTDPIAVMGILQKLGIPKDLEMRIVGESLFNDGVGVVIFMTLFSIAEKGVESVTTMGVIGTFVEEVFGGLALGIGLGYLVYWMMTRIQNYQIEILLMLAVVMVGTVLAQQFHFSAPLAMVAAGLLLGNNNLKEKYLEHNSEPFVIGFWELVDMLLNAILFVLLGLEIVVLTLRGDYFLAGLIAIPVVLLSRYISLLLPIAVFSRTLYFQKNTGLIMTWSGLRGGISVAMALSLDKSMDSELFLFVTYIVVIFSIMVQGLTLDKVIRKLLPDFKFDNIKGKKVEETGSEINY